ncbi:hypothetical protein PG999_005449 [Apiospora kogelbergensis]|uniref:Uncharacterized protein n=1 Tax=Apiospora kogelbergensis TaxID=1337665 RepID=A0AAW0R2A6_9PEZI
MPSTRSRGGVADIAAFEQWSQDEINRRTLKKSDYNAQLKSVFESSGGNVTQTQIDELKEWVESFPLKQTKGKKVVKSNKKTTPHAEEPKREKKGSDTQKAGEGGAPPDPVSDQLERVSRERAENDALWEKLQAASRRKAQEKAQEEALSTRSQVIPEDTLLEQLKAAALKKTQGQVVNTKPIQDMLDVQQLSRQLQLRKHKSSGVILDKRLHKKKPISGTEGLTSKRTRPLLAVAPKNRRPRPKVVTVGNIDEGVDPVKVEEEDVTMDDIPGGLDSRGYYARSPRASPTAVDATTRSTLGIESTEASSDEEESEEEGSQQTDVVSTTATRRPNDHLDETATDSESSEIGETAEVGYGTDIQEDGETDEEEEDEIDNIHRNPPLAPTPAADLDVTALLTKYPLKFSKHNVSSKTPREFRYKDYLTGDWVQATCHHVQPLGGMFVSFPGRNPDYPNIRAGTIVKGGQYRQAKKNFLASGGPRAVHRDPVSFEHFSLEEFQLVVLGSKPDENPDRYPETCIIGRFKSEDYLSTFMRSTFEFVYGVEPVEEILAERRIQDGTPHPKKAIQMGWAKRSRKKVARRVLTEEE